MNTGLVHGHEILAQKIWNFCKLTTPVSKADAVVVLCSHDIRIAKYASDLFHQGLAPLLIFSGGLNGFTSKIYSTSEAEAFAKVALSEKVPASSILVETRSTNTQENLEFTMSLLQNSGRHLSSAILVQMPSMLRRVYATATKLFPEISFSVTSHDISFEDAPHPFLSKEMLIHQLVGDLQRLRVYADRGFIAPQDIDPTAWDAFLTLKDLGYVGNLVS
jgi:uncharacterized SAM-binding protein YcdF (DUF218 family)